MQRPSLVLALFLASFFAAAGPVLADEFDLGALLEDAKPVGDRWERCAALNAKRELRGGRPAAEVARLAIAACKREEAALKGVLKREIGGERAETVIELVRKIYEADLARVITTLRER